MTVTVDVLLRICIWRAKEWRWAKKRKYSKKKRLRSEPIISEITWCSLSLKTVVTQQFCSSEIKIYPINLGCLISVCLEHSLWSDCSFELKALKKMISLHCGLIAQLGWKEKMVICSLWAVRTGLKRKNRERCCCCLSVKSPLEPPGRGRCARI